MTLSAVSEAGRPHIGERRRGPIIDGAAVDPSGKDFGVIDPSTGAEFARVAAGDAAMVDRAVKSAHRAFDDWRERSPHERAALLREVAARIRSHADELTELETREVGKPRRISEEDLAACCGSEAQRKALVWEIAKMLHDWEQSSALPTELAERILDVVAHRLVFEDKPQKD